MRLLIVDLQRFPLLDGPCLTHKPVVGNLPPAGSFLTSRTFFQLPDSTVYIDSALNPKTVTKPMPQPNIETALAPSPVIPSHPVLVDEAQSNCLVMLYALFASDQPLRARDYFNAIAFSYSAPFREKVREMHAAIADELKAHKLDIINDVSPGLRKISICQRRKLLLNLDTLIELQKENSLQNFAALRILRTNLGVEIPLLKKSSKKVAQ